MKVLISPWMLLVFLIAALGYGIVQHIAGRKWGYTPKREKELEKAEEIHK